MRRGNVGRCKDVIRFSSINELSHEAWASLEERLMDTLGLCSTFLTCQGRKEVYGVCRAAQGCKPHEPNLVCHCQLQREASRPAPNRWTCTGAPAAAAAAAAAADLPCP